MMNAVVKTYHIAASREERKPRIVVVDDSRATLALYSRSVSDMDVDIRQFESPLEGFDYLKSHPADLIFLGNLMRETDGMTLLRRLRELPRHRHTSVVIMSTKDYDQDRGMARELGALAYLVKPVPSREIKEVIYKYTAVHAICE
jgi:DNA-binding response OmpR family regulator